MRNGIREAEGGFCVRLREFGLKKAIMTGFRGSAPDFKGKAGPARVQRSSFPGAGKGKRRLSENGSSSAALTQGATTKKEIMFSELRVSAYTR